MTQGNTTTVIEGSTDGKFYISGLPDLGKENRDYIIFATDGIATVIANGTEVPTVGRGYDWYRPKMSDVAHNPITAYFEKGADTVYTSQDVSCYSGATSRDPRVRGPEDLLNACLEKGDKVFLFNNQIATYKQAKASDWHPESGGNMYEIVKIGANPTSSKTAEVEDRFYFVVDKVIKWDGSATQPRSGITTASADDDATTAYDDWTDDALRESPAEQRIGMQMIVKFEPASTNNYEYVSQCSGRGLCDSSSGLCECFTGYTNDNCAQQSAIAV